MNASSHRPLDATVAPVPFNTVGGGGERGGAYPPPNNNVDGEDDPLVFKRVVSYSPERAKGEKRGNMRQRSQDEQQPLPPVADESNGEPRVAAPAPQRKVEMSGEEDASHARTKVSSKNSKGDKKEKAKEDKRVAKKEEKKMKKRDRRRRKQRYSESSSDSSSSSSTYTSSAGDDSSSSEEEEEERLRKKKKELGRQLFGRVDDETKKMAKKVGSTKERSAKKKDEGGKKKKSGAALTSSSSAAPSTDFSFSSSSSYDASSFNSSRSRHPSDSDSQSSSDTTDSDDDNNSGSSSDAAIGVLEAHLRSALMNRGGGRGGGAHPTQKGANLLDVRRLLAVAKKRGLAEALAQIEEMAWPHGGDTESQEAQLFGGGTPAGVRESVEAERMRRPLSLSLQPHPPLPPVVGGGGNLLMSPPAHSHSASVGGGASQHRYASPLPRPHGVQGSTVPPRGVSRNFGTAVGLGDDGLVRSVEPFGPNSGAGRPSVSSPRSGHHRFQGQNHDNDDVDAENQNDLFGVADSLDPPPQTAAADGQGGEEDPSVPKRSVRFGFAIIQRYREETEEEREAREGREKERAKRKQRRTAQHDEGDAYSSDGADDGDGFEIDEEGTIIGKATAGGTKANNPFADKAAATAGNIQGGGEEEGAEESTTAHGFVPYLQITSVEKSLSSPSYRMGLEVGDVLRTATITYESPHYSIREAFCLATARDFAKLLHFLNCLPRGLAAEVRMLRRGVNGSVSAAEGEEGDATEAVVVPIVFEVQRQLPQAPFSSDPYGASGAFVIPSDPFQGTAGGGGPPPVGRLVHGGPAGTAAFAPLLLASHVLTFTHPTGADHCDPVARRRIPYNPVVSLPCPPPPRPKPQQQTSSSLMLQQQHPPTLAITANPKHSEDDDVLDGDELVLGSTPPANNNTNKGRGNTPSPDKSKKSGGGGATSPYMLPPQQTLPISLLSSVNSKGVHQQSADTSRSDPPPKQQKQSPSRQGRRGGKTDADDDDEEEALLNGTQAFHSADLGVGDRINSTKGGRGVGGVMNSIPPHNASVLNMSNTNRFNVDGDSSSEDNDDDDDDEPLDGDEMFLDDEDGNTPVSKKGKGHKKPSPVADESFDVAGDDDEEGAGKGKHAAATSPRRWAPATRWSASTNAAKKATPQKKSNDKDSANSPQKEKKPRVPSHIVAPSVYGNGSVGNKSVGAPPLAKGFGSSSARTCNMAKTAAEIAEENDALYRRRLEARNPNAPRPWAQKSPAKQRTATPPNNRRNISKPECMRTDEERERDGISHHSKRTTPPPPPTHRDRAEDTAAAAFVCPPLSDGFSPQRHDITSPLRSRRDSGVGAGVGDDGSPRQAYRPPTVTEKVLGSSRLFSNAGGDRSTNTTAITEPVPAARTAFAHYIHYSDKEEEYRNHRRGERGDHLRSNTNDFSLSPQRPPAGDFPIFGAGPSAAQQQREQQELRGVNIHPPAHHSAAEEEDQWDGQNATEEYDEEEEDRYGHHYGRKVSSSRTTTTTTTTHRQQHYHASTVAPRHLMAGAASHYEGVEAENHHHNQDEEENVEEDWGEDGDNDYVEEETGGDASEYVHNISHLSSVAAPADGAGSEYGGATVEPSLDDEEAQRNLRQQFARSAPTNQQTVAASSSSSVTSDSDSDSSSSLTSTSDDDDDEGLVSRTSSSAVSLSGHYRGNASTTSSMRRRKAALWKPF